MEASWGVHEQRVKPRLMFLYFFFFNLENF